MLMLCLISYQRAEEQRSSAECNRLVTQSGPMDRENDDQTDLAIKSPYQFKSLSKLKIAFKKSLELTGWLVFPRVFESV